MKAEQIMTGCGTAKRILHRDVIEIATNGRRRRYMCKCCNMKWYEEINSPTILPDDTYISKGAIDCSLNRI